MEKNSLVLAGTHERVFVSELQTGDVNAFGETVTEMHRSTDSLTRVTYDTGQTLYFANPMTTILIERG